VYQQLLVKTNELKLWCPGLRLSTDLFSLAGSFNVSVTVCNLSTEENSKVPHPMIFFNSMSADVATLKSVKDTYSKLSLNCR